MEEIKKILTKAVEKLFGIKVEVSVTPAPENTGADYASNVAMQLAKIVHKAPMVIAEMLADEFSSAIALLDSPVRGHRISNTAPLRASNLPSTDSKTTSSGEAKDNNEAVVDGSIKVEIAVPGFLNFTVGNEEVIEKVLGYAGDLDKELKLNEYAGKMVVAEFSDPNPFKVLHVGHLYTSVVGDSISRLLELAGAKVVRANFGGDVGLHVGKTMYGILQKKYRPGDLTIEDIAKCYVEGTQAYEESEQAKAQITWLNKEIYRINAEKLHDTELAELYWRGRELSYEYFDGFYAKIGLKFDKYYPESSVADKGLAEVRAHTGTVYEESDGAVVYKGEKVGLHTRVFINREGVPTYETKDVGLIFTKWDDWHFDESVVITGNEQSDYMKVVLASVAEYAPQLVERTRHLTHGMVKLPGNVKMSSRKGNFLKAIDVLHLVEDQLRVGGSSDRIADNGQTSLSEDAMLTHRMSNTARSASLSSLNSAHSKRLNETERGKVDSRVLLAAIKYAFLKYKMGGDIVFDLQESVSTTGNSGVYLLYSAVRAKKILQKCGKSDEKMPAGGQDAEYEKNLCKKIVQYQDVLREAVKELAPYKVCTYLYELAQEFSRFYEHVKVAGSENEEELAEIVRAYLKVMEHGLSLLGIEVPEEM